MSVLLIGTNLCTLLFTLHKMRFSLVLVFFVVFAFFCENSQSASSDYVPVVLWHGMSFHYSFFMSVISKNFNFKRNG